MKKRFLALFLIVLLAISGCAPSPAAEEGGTLAQPDDTPALDDYEFFGAPEVIVRATAESITSEYFTSPYGGDDSQNAHVTVFKLAVSEVYKGTLEGDGETLHIKIFNGEGMSKAAYEEQLAGKKITPFLLETGKEYILGLTSLDSLGEEYYSESSGYVIEAEQLWTFALNKDGTYENLVSGANHKILDIPTLKEKIENLYKPDPPAEVVPRYAVDESWKDPAITTEQREQFFELVKEWRVDAMYEFTPEKPMELELFKYYCAYFVTEEEKTYVDTGVHYTGAAINRIAKRFGASYDLADDEPVFVKAGSLKDLPFAELIQYKEEQVDGKTLITARCIDYSIPTYYYVDWDHAETMESYPTHKAMILAGEVTGYEYYTIFDFSFYTEDGKTPTQFVSFDSYFPESIFDGSYPLPEFISAENAASDSLTKETVILSETPTLERLADGVFYYGIQSFYPSLEGKESAEFREILKTDPLAMNKLSNQAKKDSENKLCEHHQVMVMGGYSLDWENYQYAEYEIINISDALHSFWLICPPKSNPEKLFESMILMNAPEDSTIVRSTRWLVPLTDGVYFLRIQRFSPTIDGKQINFEELLKSDPQAGEKLVAQAKADAKKDLCKMYAKYDGGTVEFHYEDYTIIKFHAFNSDTEEPDDYLEALVIAPKGMDHDTVFDAVFRGMVPI